MAVLVSAASHAAGRTSRVATPPLRPFATKRGRPLVLGPLGG